MSDSRAASLRAAARQLGHFVVFVARQFPLFHGIVVLTFVVLVFEYAATSLMIPLSSSGAQSNSGAIRLWGRALDWMGLPHVPQTWLWLFFVVMAARLVFGYLQTASTTLLGKRVHRALSGRIFSHVVAGEPLTAVYQRSVGHYITLAGDDTSRCGTIITSLLQCCVTLATALVAIIILYQFSPLLFFAVTGFVAACAVTIAILLRYTLRLNSQANLLSRELNTAFVEALNNLRSIRALHAERFVTVTYAGQIGQYVWMLFKIDAVRAAIKSLPAVVLLVIAAVLMRSGSSVSLSEATLLAVTIIIIRIFTSLGQFIGHGSILITDVRAIRDIDALTAARADESETPALAAAATVESLELQGIDFGFSAQHPILKNFSFRFEKGRTYAIVGPSGSGKSTLADIMLGLVQPQGGAVLVNSGRVPLSAVRGKLMLVEQQPRIFSTTLRENLLFGFEAGDEVLWEALRLVDLDATVRHMRNGLDTVLSYQGENFSGGQRQRIGIARALIRTPDLLMLDEATSALDAATRSAVIANVKRRLHEGVLIMITHDTHLLELADEVIDFARVRDASRLAVVR